MFGRCGCSVLAFFLEMASRFRAWGSGVYPCRLEGKQKTYVLGDPCHNLNKNKLRQLRL